MNRLKLLRIKCADCVYAHIDKKVSTKRWTAYMCGNTESDYYGSLLNVTPNGCKADGITWIGCASGKPIERSVTL